MKLKSLFLIIPILFGTQMSIAQNGKVIKNLTTGLDDAVATTITYGSNDDTWRVGVPGKARRQATIVCKNLAGIWAVDGCGRWITSSVESDHTPSLALVGKYTYFTAFQLNSNCLSWVKINLFKFGADDRAANFKINGYSYTISPSVSSWFNPLIENVTININTNHLVQGANFLEVEVDNDQANQGLFICGNITTNYCP